jgi:integrase
VHVERLPSGNWRVTVQSGGERRRGTASTKAEARRLGAELLVAMGGVVSSSRATVRDLIDEHVARANLSATTRADYLAVVKRLDDSPGDLLDREARLVRPADLDATYRRLAGLGWSEHRVSRLHQVLGAAYSAAVRLDIVRDNPTRRVTPPAPQRPDITPPSVDEIRAMLDEAPPHFTLYLLLAAVTGARRGELVALRWADVDVDDGTIVIRRSLVQVAGEAPLERPTKTGRKGHRVVSVGGATLDALKAHRDAQQAFAADQGLPSPVWVFSNDAGLSPWRPDYATQVFVRVRRRNGAKFRLHDLRHYVATSMLLDGVSPVQVAGRLGHSTTTTTLRTYAHFLRAEDREAAARLDDRIHRTENRS